MNGRIDEGMIRIRDCRTGYRISIRSEAGKLPNDVPAPANAPENALGMTGRQASNGSWTSVAILPVTHEPGRSSTLTRCWARQSYGKIVYRVNKIA